MDHRQPLAAVPAERLEAAIADLKPLMTPAQAHFESHRCLFCHDAPCVKACPTAINVPQFIKRIATDDVVGAAKTILSANALGLSCARVCPVEVLCAGSCVYHAKGEPPIAIGRLQRYATEQAYRQGARFFRPGAPTGRKVALIGAGPASLACAAILRQLGHEAIVFESKPLPGGLNTYGIAPYKLHVEDALAEIEVLKELGMELRCAVEVGKDVTFAELERQFDAIFLGVGLGADSTLDVPGEDVPGCMGAVALIEKIKTEPRFRLDGVRHAAVVGGGNTAIDVARELCHLGVERVKLVYRRSEKQMSGYRHELELAKKEGVELVFLATPVGVEGTTRVIGLRCQKMELGAPDATGRQSPMPVRGSDFVLPADLVVVATGQGSLAKLVHDLPGMTFARGRIVVDEKTGQCGNPKYFAGGDCVNGGKEVVNAVDEGQRAARGIDSYLRQVPAVAAAAHA